MLLIGSKFVPSSDHLLWKDQISHSKGVFGSVGSTDLKGVLVVDFGSVKFH